MNQVVTSLSHSYCEWHIQKEIINANGIIESPIFLCSRKKQWQFDLDWNYHSYSKNFMRLKLKRINENDTEDKVDNNKSYICVISKLNNEKEKRSLFENTYHEFSNICQENLGEYLCNGLLKIRFLIVTKLKNKRGTLSDLPSSTLYNNSYFSDVQLFVGDKSYYAHKAILANCSQVFATMFKIDMKEKKDNIVKIDDLNAETVECMLQFVYTGKVNTLDDNVVFSLLMASDKYQMEHLKDFCKNYLYDSMNLDNCIEIAEFADRYKMDLLKFWAKNFIAVNIKQISKSKKFTELAKTNNDLLLEIVSYSFDYNL
ncbi:speckle-type POZ protein-like [Trichogramma pretiosum]|uniref:speckle-type POZ protein-like n=1 Tax=Trichogramma pretiosum TaxID=7493 RepID=UPI0006C96965|nr:speckle-type POZ protein-like [Trichogramma pretiosum]